MTEQKVYVMKMISAVANERKREREREREKGTETFSRRSVARSDLSTRKS